MMEMVIMAREDEEVEVQLVKNFEPLIKKCIRIYVKDYSYYDDAIQEGRFTVLQCIRRYDIISPIPFEGYVKMAVIYSIRDFAHKIRVCVSLDDEINEDGGSLYDILRSDQDIEVEKIHREELMELKKAFDRLPENYRSIIQKFYFEKISLREICRNRRCHYMTAVKLKERALKNLKEQLEFILPGFDE
jgi:RNA polymerase sporulation-specific sigma factor